MSSHQQNDFHLIMTEDHSSELGHVLPKKMYVRIFLSLLFLTFVTVAVTRVDFGSFNIIIAMTVASVKALLVALFFMHLKYEDKLTWAYAIFPFILLALLIGGVFIDNPFREKPLPVEVNVPIKK